MNNPSPHSFSRSPVKEVFCCCIPSPGSEALSRTIPAPYPGWPQIRDGIREMITDTGDISGITGCMLRYIDLIPADCCRNLSEPVDITYRLSGKIRSPTSGDTGEKILISTGVPNTAGSVSSMYNEPEKTDWTLIFTIYTEKPAGFSSGIAVLNWFDDARAEIHGLFDLIVPEEIAQALR